MLKLKEPKSLVKPVSQTYDNPFDVNFLQNKEQTKMFQVELDPMNHLVYLTISIENQNLIITLSADQSVSVGQWLLEAGYVINFVEKTQIQFEEEEADE